MTGFPDFDSYFQPVSLTGKSYLKMKANRGIATGVWSSPPPPDERSRGVFFLTEGGVSPDTLGINLWNGSAFAPYYPLLSTDGNLSFTDGIVFVMNGMGSPIATGVAGELLAPYPFEITAAYLFAKPSGSIQVDIWADVMSAATPEDADSITSVTPPAIVAGVEYSDETLTGWDTTHPAMTQLVFNVDSVATVTKATLVLAIERSL